MYALRDKYAIAGIGCTQFSKKSGRTVRSLASEACLKATATPVSKVSDIDGIVSFNFNDSVPASRWRRRSAFPRRAMPSIFWAGERGQHDRVDRGRGDRGGARQDGRCAIAAMNGRSGIRLGGGRELAPMAHAIHRSVRLDHLSAGHGDVVPAAHDRIRHHPEQLGEIAVRSAKRRAITRGRCSATRSRWTIIRLAHDRRPVPYARYLPRDRRRLRGIGHFRRARAGHAHKPIHIWAAPMAADRTRARTSTPSAGRTIRTIMPNTLPTISGAAPDGPQGYRSSPKSTIASPTA